PDVNVTPLIDVLLVLLVMMILTVPVATHQTTIGLPSGKTKAVPEQMRLAIDFDGRIFWNDSPDVDEAQLLRYLHYVAAFTDQPLVIVEPDSRAPYERVAQVLAAAQRSNVQRLSLIGTND